MLLKPKPIIQLLYYIRLRFGFEQKIERRIELFRAPFQSKSTIFYLFIIL